MTINEFLDSKEIKHKEIEENFKLEKKLEVDFVHHIPREHGCLNCGDKHNQYSLKTESWTNAYQCIACTSIIFAFISDRMGGAYTDTVYIYKEK